MSNEAVVAEIDGVVGEFDALITDIEGWAFNGTTDVEQAIIQARELLLEYKALLS